MVNGRESSMVKVSELNLGGREGGVILEVGGRLWC